MTEDGRSPDSAPPVSVIGSTVVMKGDLVVDEALVIEGTYAGTINASETVIVRRTAKLSGEVAAARVRVQVGTKLDKASLAGEIRLIAD